MGQGLQAKCSDETTATVIARSGYRFKFNYYLVRDVGMLELSLGGSLCNSCLALRTRMINLEVGSVPFHNDV